jgi:hypothetical protein
VSTVQTIHRELADLWNARDYDGLRNLMHPDYTYTASDGTESARIFWLICASFSAFLGDKECASHSFGEDIWQKASRVPIVRCS